MSTSTPPNPLQQPRWTNIQGNIVAGFNKDFQKFAFLQFDDRDRARKWLGYMADHVATTEEVLAFNDLFRKVKARRGDEFGTVKATWAHIALSARGLDFIGALNQEVKQFADAFAAGMAARAGALGDTDENAPDKWLPAFREGRIHALLLVASDDEADLDRELIRLLDRFFTLGAGSVLHVETGRTLPGALKGHEHFGFKDGISQPDIKELVNAGLAPSPEPGDPQPVALGEFVLGHANDAGPVTNIPDILLDGSFLVFRKLNQDVAKFRQEIGQLAGELSMSPDEVGAKLVGRWKSGAPLALAPNGDNVALANANAFGYQNDQAGSITPRFAHIRKANPRDEATAIGDPVSRQHRIIRRGIPYGDPLPETGAAPEEIAKDRGLLFVSYQASLEGQFEFVQQKWINNPNFPFGPSGSAPQPQGGYPQPPQTLPVSEPDGPDPIVGQHDQPAKFALQSKQFQLPQFVQMRGGEYFFSPSIRALRALAGLSA